MNEASLLAFQIEEVIDAAKYILCGFVIVLGIGLWMHAKFWRDDEKS
tara:strand:- start:88 stop:228 length:141 start_codon:yes stop_codon:yes gene_type:complete